MAVFRTGQSAEVIDADANASANFFRHRIAITGSRRARSEIAFDQDSRHLGQRRPQSRTFNSAIELACGPAGRNVNTAR